MFKTSFGFEWLEEYFLNLNRAVSCTFSASQSYELCWDPKFRDGFLQPVGQFAYPKTFQGFVVL